MNRCASLLANVVGSLLPLSMPSGAVAQSIMGIASVIDGDTIEIHGTRIRLHGIDVPESRRVCMRPTGEEWRCGQQAALALSERIGRSTIRCEPRDRDRYGRIVAICFKGNDDMNRWMVASGWAVAYRKYSWDYVVDEERAHSGRFKLWSGSFEMLWDWRQQRQHR